MSELRIIVEKGNEYQAKSENIYRKDAFFRDAYMKARECIKEILYADKIFHDPYEENKLCSDAELNAALKGYSNNFIAFCANRGQGKTSTMLSFAQALKENKQQGKIDTEIYYTIEEFWNGTDVMNHHFEVIDSIDPTTMENRDSVLNVILSRMFNRFQETWEQRYEQGRYRDSLKDLEIEKDRIARLFKKCYHSLQILKSEKMMEEDDELEQIMGMGDSSNMRGMIYRLVREYLNFVGKGKNSYLILQIDDADLSIEKTYDIIEDIRKYLVMPKVIVLLAVNMKQLESTVEQYFITQYLTSIKNGGMVDVEQCHEIAERYIDKVIPGQRQIYLPNLSHVLTDRYDEIVVSYLENRHGEKYDLLGQEQETEKRKYQDQLLDLVRQKTGMVLMSPETYLHNILPGSMRELTHFLLYFGNMDQLSAGYDNVFNIFQNEEEKSEGYTYSESLYQWKTNLQKFQHYLVELWSAVNLRETGRNLLKSLAREPSNNKNGYILKVLPDYYKKEKEEYRGTRGVSVPSEKGYREQFIEQCEKRGVYLSDKSDKNRCTSYADVYAALSVLGELQESNRQYKFIYAVRLYYSIHMHILLIEQIEKNSNGEKDNLLVGFIEDALYRKGDSNTILLNLPNIRFDLNGQKLRTYLNHIDYATQQDKTPIKRFCRKKFLGTETHRIIDLTSTEIDNMTDNNGKLVFNVFYPFLYELDMLCHSNEAEKAAYLTEGKARAQLIVALVVLLNYDVQYNLERNLREGKWEGPLPECIKSIYGMEKINEVLRKAGIEEKLLEDFKAIYENTEEYRLQMLAVQLSCEEMSDWTKKYYKKKMNSVEELYVKLKKLWGGEGEDKKIKDKIAELEEEYNKAAEEKRNAENIDVQINKINLTYREIIRGYNEIAEFLRLLEDSAKKVDMNMEITLRELRKMIFSAKNKIKKYFKW